MEVHIIPKHRSICTRRQIKLCLVSSIPTALVVLAVIITTAIFFSHNKSDESVRYFEVSRHHQQCVDAIDTGVPLIRLGSVNSFQYKDISITQDYKVDPAYEAVTTQIYAVPSRLVIERTKWFTCNYSLESGVFLNIEQLYLLQGSSISFNIGIKSTNETNPGLINLTIFDNNTDYKHRNGEIFQQHQFHVKANQSNSSEYNFIATRDSLYSVISCGLSICGPDSNASLISYKFDVKMKYVSYTDWTDTAYNTSVCKLDNSVNKCSFPVGNSNDWFFSAESYDILAHVISGPAQSEAVGFLKITASFRSKVLVYNIATVIGGILLAIVYYVFCGVGCCVYRVKRQRRQEQELQHIN